MEKDALKDYSLTDKLKLYEELTESWPIGKNLSVYNMELLLSDVKGKTVLDLPCGIGSYVHRLFNRGATKVIASDIVSRQLEVAMEKDKKLGIPDGFVEYYQHDAKIPKQLCSDLADMCLSAHLFCFAENEDELRGMTRTILANLQPGGYCLIVTCLLGSASDNEQERWGELQKFEEELVHLDPPTSERFKPRHYHTIIKGFHLNRQARLLICIRELVDSLCRDITDTHIA